MIFIISHVPETEGIRRLKSRMSFIPDGNLMPDCRSKVYLHVHIYKNLQMSKKKKKAPSSLIARRLQRKLAIQQGFYDGRFKEKTIKDKRKEESRKSARRKVDISKEE
jgi:hypothetical protein